MKQLLFFCLALLLFMTVACQSVADKDSLSGVALLWYPAGSAEEVSLRGILAQFSEIHPNVRVVAVPFEEAELGERFRDSASQGLGPDILFGLNTQISQWVDDGLISPIPTDAINGSLYTETVLQSVRYREQQYGVPLALRPQALLVNAVSDGSDSVVPPETLAQWLSQADAGVAALINARFWDAYWGVQAFGGSALQSEALST